MSRKLWLVVVLLVVLVGCAKQPEIDVEAEQNQTEQNVTEQNQTEQNVTEQNITEQNQTETDLTDTTEVVVTEDSMIDATPDTSLNQDLAQSLSDKVVYFDFDKFNIRSDQMHAVEEVANVLRDNQTNFTVRIEGNCDEWGSDEYNYALGLKRAKTVKQALVDLGVDGEKLTIISYGESNPVCTAHNRECWAKNRRDNFTLLP